MKKSVILSSTIFLIDRILKIIVEKFLELEKSKYIINKFLYLYRCHNTGAAFSIFNNSTNFLIIISLIVLFVIFYLYKKNNYTDSIIYGLLIGGILGNLVDRIIYGYVIDYIGVTLFNYNFAIFNFADIIIVLSGIYLIVRK